MFQLCSELYERVTLIVTTNIKFADLTQDFGDERLAVALLDGLTHLFAKNTLPANPR
jgi:DNA replication protein DnaC